MRERRLAELLLAVRRGKTGLLTDLPAALVPPGPAAVRLVQELVMAELGPRGGWKVGASGSTGPIGFAPLPATGIVPSGAVLVGWHQRWVEAEIAVKLAHDLPLRDEPYGDAEVMAAIGSVHPVIEVLNSRFADVSRIDPQALAADLIMHGGLVVGAATEMPDLAAETVIVSIDGQVASRGRGHPAGGLPRLLRHLADQVGLQAGEIVTTGSWNPVTVPPEHCTVTIRFAQAGEVGVSFQPSRS